MISMIQAVCENETIRMVANKHCPAKGKKNECRKFSNIKCRLK